jgi:bacillithiol synthase
VRISFRGAPGTSPLFLDYLDAWPHLQRYYSSYYSPEAIAEFAAKRPRLEASHLERLCAVLTEQQQRWGASTTGVDKLKLGAVAVVTGQQPGLFTGPIFSIYKAITAIKLVAFLNESGIPAVPVFWIAAEDHDQEEICSTSVLTKNEGIEHIRISLCGEREAPVGWTQFGDDIGGALRQCIEALPQSEDTSDIKNLLESTYRPGVSPVDAFARMMAKLFAGREIIFVDPLDPELKELAKPTLLAAVEANEAIRNAVLDRSNALLGAGYHAQVKVDQGFTGLFEYSGKSRRVLKPAELNTRATLSPNALLRPVVQDSLFPTVAYIGGPAEIAYFAQAAPIYEALRRPMPPIFPRISATVVERRIKRALQRYDFDFLHVFKGPEALKRFAVERSQDVTAFDRADADVNSAMESLRPLLDSVDPTLLGALGTSERKMRHQVQSLRTKFLNAEVKRNEILARRIDAIINSLYPEKKLQERVFNVTSFLMRYGSGLIGWLERRLDIDSTEHQILEID